jgi:hypothetical protein
MFTEGASAVEAAASRRTSMEDGFLQEIDMLEQEIIDEDAERAEEAAKKAEEYEGKPHGHGSIIGSILSFASTREPSLTGRSQDALEGMDTPRAKESSVTSKSDEPGLTSATATQQVGPPHCLTTNPTRAGAHSPSLWLCRCLAVL